MMMAKIQCQAGVCNRSPLGYEEMVASRAGICYLDSVMYVGCLGKGSSAGFIMLTGLTWGCLFVPSKQEPVKKRKPEWGEEPWCTSCLICSHLTIEAYLFC